MTRFEYIDALRQALSGQPPEVIAATVAEYERRIRDASAAGQSEDDILDSLGDPQKIAAERRSAPSASMAVKHDERPASFVRMFFSFMGLMVLNLFLAIPAILYSALLLASFLLALTLYGSGIVMTGASLAGVEGISFDRSDHPAVLTRRDAASAATDNRTPPNPSATSAKASASASIQIADVKSIAKIGPNDIGDSDASSKVRIGEDRNNLGLSENKHGVNIDMPGLHIHNPAHSRDFYFNTSDVSASRPLQVSIGIGLILAGIVAFLLCLALAKLTLVGILRLAQMEFSILKNA